MTLMFEVVKLCRASIKAGSVTLFSQVQVGPNTHGQIMMRFIFFKNVSKLVMNASKTAIAVA